MKKIFTLCGVLLLFTQCAEDVLNDNNDIIKTQKTASMSLEKRNDYLKDFSGILSKSIYNNAALRAFLKEEELKKFDNDYDILYQLVKNKSIEGKTFREILVSNSSEERITEIEQNLPLLNILIPNIEMFNINPENLDANDNDIPVIFAKGDKNIYYFNGKEDFTTNLDEVPSFHAFVVNENSVIEKIIIPENLNSKSQISLVSASEPSITFISPIYDNRYPTAFKILTRNVSGANNISQKVKDSFKYFYSDGSDNHQKAFQRDYIYYGMTPNSTEGRLNQNIKEEINYMTIDPGIYFSISKHSENPKIIVDGFTRKKRPVSTEEQIKIMWSDGIYKFLLHNITSNSSQPEIKDFYLKPSDIWNFNIEYSRKGGSFWKRSKHTYRIDPKRFTPKVINFKDLNIDLKLDKWNWNLSKEALSRKLKLVQFNNSEDYTSTENIEYTFIKEKKGLGLTSTKTTKRTQTTTIKGTRGSVELGEATAYFYDPVVINSNYDLYRYSTGSVQFSMIPN